MKRALSTILLLVPLAACSEAVDPPGGDGGKGGGSEGTPLSVTVPDQGRVFVKLDPPAVASLSGDGTKSTDWDLAFEGLDIYTNDGPSGPGAGGAFGPLDAAVMSDDKIPEVPFIQHDAAGGAFLGWYLYDGTAHALYSRYHVHGVRDGDRLWKVQILGYYGEAQGAPVSALYQLRYAEVTSTGAKSTETRMDIDGTAGGLSAPPGAASTCLDLGTGQTVSLSSEQALASSAWHLCFRRDEVSVNGGLGGPRGVTAVDLDADRTASEKDSDVKARTATSELGRFDAVTHAGLTDSRLAYHGDRIVSAFSDHWIEPASSPLAPVAGTWLVVAADGLKNHLITFDSFTKPTAVAPGTVKLRSKTVE